MLLKSLKHVFFICLISTFNTDTTLEDLFRNPNIEQCNSLDGDCITPADMTECVCERTCLYGGSRVCGSDGIIYENYCLLEMAACQMNTNIRTMPMNYCPGR